MSSNKTIIKNSAFLYLRLLITIAIGLFSTRVVLQAMGVEDFGIYGVVAGLVSMFTFLSSAMSSSTQRYLAFDLGKQDYSQLQKTFTTVLNIHLVIAIISMVVAEVVGQWVIRSFLTIPEERLDAAIHAYHYVVILFGFGIIRVPFHAAIIANEKMEAFAYISILESILKLAAAYLLFTATADLLVLYSQLLALTALIIFLLYFIYSKAKFPETKYLKYFDKGYYKEILSFSGWNLFGNIAAVLRGQGVNILINVFFGVVANAAYALTLMVQGVFTSFAASVQQAINPQIIKSFSAKDLGRTEQLIFLGSKFSFVAILLLITPFLSNIDYVLGVWLTEVPENTTIFISYILIFVLIESLSGALMTALQATGKIKTYQLVVGLMVLANFPIVWVLYSLSYSVEIAFLVFIAVSFASLYARLFFVKRHVGLNYSVFHRQVLLRVLLLSLIIFLVSQVSFIEHSNFKFSKLLVETFLYSILIIFCSYIVVLSKKEKELINIFIKERLFKK